MHAIRRYRRAGKTCRHKNSASCRHRGTVYLDRYDAAAQTTGLMLWSRPQQSTAKYYPNGFDLLIQPEASTYVPPGLKEKALNLGSAFVLLEGAGLKTTIANEVLLTTANTVINAGTNSFTMNLDRASGQFSGSVRVPGSATGISFKGALLQEHNCGYGFFLSPEQSGKVYFGVEH